MAMIPLHVDLGLDWCESCHALLTFSSTLPEFCDNEFCPFRAEAEEDEYDKDVEAASPKHNKGGATGWH